MSDRIVVVDYGAGNVCSVDNSLRAAGADVVVSGDPDVIARAERIVLPGVGAFGQCIGTLRAHAGIEDALTQAVRVRGVPFLGICVGMQLLADEGHEHGVHRGLGWIGGAVARLDPPGLKVPHMGWNSVDIASDHPALAALPRTAHAYFVHSYAMTVADSADLLATAEYGAPVAAIVGRDTILGVQFHPEKSQAYGLAFLRGFLAWRP